MLVFDLDPGAPATILECAQVALWLRDVFDAARPRCVRQDLRLQGPAGLRPAQHADVTYDQTKPFAQAVAQLLEKQHPELRRLDA